MNFLRYKAIFATSCFEDDYVLLREAIPLNRRIPYNDIESWWFDNVSVRDAHQIQELGWDDSEFYFYGLTYKRLINRQKAVLREYGECLDRGKKLFADSYPPSDAESTAWLEEESRLKKEMDDVERRVNQAKLSPDPYFCDARTECLKRGLDKYYKEGRRVVAVAGSDHFPPKLLREIATRGVIIVILKGTPLPEPGDRKSP